ncbi:MAG TPA: prepilin-type N-terminal cleavage/methylation domain-containing protein [Kofleriaceae bacterium]|nr:prepilin-type N-terminal cleavage/methylation domain-containing protein [Kofleriaceae bacterium]
MVRRRHGGFTIIELMIAVAVIAILATVALPMYMSETRRSKAKSEVGAVFAELGVRESQYKLENGFYLTAPACPAAPSSTGQSPASCLVAGQPWDILKVRLDLSSLYCSYDVETGFGAPASPAPTQGFVINAPPGAWYWIMATCDMDGDGVTFSYYFTNSMDASIQIVNDGS